MDSLEEIATTVSKTPLSKRNFDLSTIKKAKEVQSVFLSSHRKISSALKSNALKIEDDVQSKNIQEIIEHLDNLRTKVESATNLKKFNEDIFELFRSTTYLFELYPQGDFILESTAKMYLAKFKREAKRLFPSHDHLDSPDFKPIYTFGYKVDGNELHRSGVSEESYVNSLMQGYFLWQLPTDRVYADKQHMTPSQLVTHDRDHFRIVSSISIRRGIKNQRQFWYWLREMEGVNDIELEAIINSYLHFHVFEQGIKFSKDTKIDGRMMYMFNNFSMAFNDRSYTDSQLEKLRTTLESLLLRYNTLFR